jgi:hypothetical protein
VLRALARRGDVVTRTNGTDVEVKRLEHREPFTIESCLPTCD